MSFQQAPPLSVLSMTSVGTPFNKYQHLSQDVIASTGPRRLAVFKLASLAGEYVER